MIRYSSQGGRVHVQYSVTDGLTNIFHWYSYGSGGAAPPPPPTGTGNPRRRRWLLYTGGPQQSFVWPSYGSGGSTPVTPTGTHKRLYRNHYYYADPGAIFLWNSKGTSGSTVVAANSGYGSMLAFWTGRGGGALPAAPSIITRARLSGSRRAISLTGEVDE